MKNILTIFLSLVIFISITKSTDSSTEQGDLTKRFNVIKGGNLEVKVITGDIIINSWDKNEVSINIKGIAEEDFDNIKINQSGNTIKVNDKGWGASYDEIEIYIPSKFNINLKSYAGNIKILGNYEGDLTVSTEGGDINLDKIKGIVNVYTSGGNITSGDIEGNVIIKTAGGDISVKSISKDAEISTNGGDIKIGEIGNYLKARTNGGDIKIEKIGGSAETVTFGGDIIIKKVAGSVQSNTYGGDIKLFGASGIVTAKSGGGDLKLWKISGSVVATTGAGDVYVELIPNGKEKSKISSGSGTIKLLLPENSKADIEARIRIEDWDDEEKYEYEIKSDFKSQIYDKNSDRDEIRAVYVLNGGGEKIILETTNSNIEIKKLSK